MHDVGHHIAIGVLGSSTAFSDFRSIRDELLFILEGFLLFLGCFSLLGNIRIEFFFRYG